MVRPNYLSIANREHDANRLRPLWLCARVCRWCAAREGKRGVWLNGIERGGAVAGENGLEPEAR